MISADTLDNLQVNNLLLVPAYSLPAAYFPRHFESGKALGTRFIVASKIASSSFPIFASRIFFISHLASRISHFLSRISHFKDLALTSRIFIFL